jgi:anti-sigma regulatory factor (Ser/Thr protein kinase)
VTTAQHTYACSPAAAGSARAWLLSALAAQLPPHEQTAEVLDEAELVVSELVTNAVLASCSITTVTITTDRSCVRIGVTDDAPGRPTLLHAATDAVRGRGLAIVCMLARDWGVTPVDPGGKEVWAEISLPPPVAELMR